MKNKNNSAKGRVLSISYEPTLGNLRHQVLERGGFEVTSANGPEEALRLLSSDSYDLALMSFLANRGERGELALAIKSRFPEMPVVVLFAGPQEQVQCADAMINALDAPEVLISRIRELLPLEKQRFSDGKYVVCVNADRRYTEVTAAVCDLLGYEREELLGMTIDDITHVSQKNNVGPLFQKYLADGSMEGLFTLRHRSGKPIKIEYRAKAMDDGRFRSEWIPIYRASR